MSGCGVDVFVELVRKTGSNQFARSIRNQKNDIADSVTLERILASVGGTEIQDGRLAFGRPDLLKAAELAEKFGAIIVARDLSRLFRPARFDWQKNRFAAYTDEDFAELRELVGNVPIATVFHPSFTLREIHRLATLAGHARYVAAGNVLGAPSRIDWEEAHNVFESITVADLSIGNAAIFNGISKSRCQYLFDTHRKYGKNACQTCVTRREKWVKIRKAIYAIAGSRIGNGV